MTKLAILEEQRIFPPKRFLLIIWIGTLLTAIYGLIATPLANGVIYVWLVIGAVAFWQIWTLHWVELDNDGIRTRNIFQQGRALRWEEVTRFHEEEVRLNKGTYAIILLSNEYPAGEAPSGESHHKRIIKIKLTDDQVNFDMLRGIVREAVPRLG